jgi:HD-GYP domain-containing protein (c-di-GMP phosphodiesterase class II)
MGVGLHKDLLAPLDRPLPLARKLEVVHASMRGRFPFVDRIAIASYDPATASLRTFADSSNGPSPLVRYEATLEEAGSLRETHLSGRPRVVNDLSVFGTGRREHTRRIRARGYRASYTLPVNLHGSLWGFVFFNSFQAGVFPPDVVEPLGVFARLVSSLALQELVALRTLRGALQSTMDMVHERDPDTGDHLARMARFARLIAVELAESGRHDLDDESIERIFLFAPLHDVVKNFGLGGFPFLKVLREVVESHHEALDGSGYPRRLRNGAISLEARIEAVADVFDALTSRRRYKAAWSNTRAFAALRRLSGTKLDATCVEALGRRRAQVEEIQARFRAHH